MSDYDELDAPPDHIRYGTVDDYEPTPVAAEIPPATGRGSYMPEPDPEPRRGTVYISSEGRHRAREQQRRERAGIGLRVWVAVVAVVGVALFAMPLVLWATDRTVTVTGNYALALFFGVAVCLLATAINALTTAHCDCKKGPR